MLGLIEANNADPNRDSWKSIADSRFASARGVRSDGTVGEHVWAGGGPALHLFAGEMRKAIAEPSIKWNAVGDVNLDRVVNMLDLIFIRSRLAQDPATGDNWQADVNGDGRINVLDLIVVRNHLSSRI